MSLRHTNISLFNEHLIEPHTPRIMMGFPGASSGLCRNARTISCNMHAKHLPTGDLWMFCFVWTILSMMDVVSISKTRDYECYRYEEDKWLFGVERVGYWTSPLFTITVIFLDSVPQKCGHESSGQYGMSWLNQSMETTIHNSTWYCKLTDA